MKNEFNNYETKSKSIDTEIIAIPQAGQSTNVYGIAVVDNAHNYRDLAIISEVHEFEISASSLTGNIDPNWKAEVDVYIKTSTNETVDLYNRLIIKDGKKYHNEKTFVLLPNQTLCYKIRNLTSSSQNDYNVQVHCSTIEFKDPYAIYYKMKIKPTPSEANIYMSYLSINSTSGELIVPENAKVDYILECKHYKKDEGNSFDANSSTIVPTPTIREEVSETLDPKVFEKTRYIQMTRLKCFSIGTNTPNANINLYVVDEHNNRVIGTPYIQEGNSIWVEAGMYVHWDVWADHYVPTDPATSFKRVDNDEIKTVNLNLVTRTLYITTDPSDADVTLTPTGGQTITGRTISVPYGTVVRCVTSKSPYQTKTEYITVNCEEESMTVHMYLYLAPNTLMFESKNPDESQNKYFRKGRYYIELVGGGSGGACGLAILSYRYYWYQTASGGSGAYVYGTIPLNNDNYYWINVGRGGKGHSGINSQVGEAGTESSVFGRVAGGGKACTATGWVGQHGTPGAGGTGSGSDVQIINGNSGTALYNHTNCAGGSSVHNGYGYGGNGNGSNGGNGYVKIIYVGPL